jgi:murein DD-endopeptidase MepM/ murein hydrolase activator NlpD
LPASCSHHVRHATLAVSLLLATLAALPPNAVTFAQARPQPGRGEPTRVQRRISDDPGIDANLVASLPTVTADDGGQRIAALGPAMRPLVVEFNSIWPTRGEITTYFGEVDRLSPRGHSGLDIAAPEGTPVVAADRGEVLKAYWNKDGYGGLIIIAHPSGYETWYGHLDSFDVDQGQQVKRGEQIGLMGSTGFSTGSHLHFEVRQDGQLRDPLAFLEEAKLQSADESDQD